MTENSGTDAVFCFHCLSSFTSTLLLFKWLCLISPALLQASQGLILSFSAPCPGHYTRLCPFPTHDESLLNAWMMNMWSEYLCESGNGKKASGDLHESHLGIKSSEAAPVSVPRLLIPWNNVHRDSLCLPMSFLPASFNLRTRGRGTSLSLDARCLLLIGIPM